MEQATQYRRHRQVQVQRILDTAQRLFITRGLEDVTLTQIAQACGITRATLYRYFNSKERILWEIHHLRMRQYGENLRALLGGRRLTTLERLTAFCNFLYAEFERDPGVFLFLRVFDSAYQPGTAPGAHGIYEKVFDPGDFGSGDTVQLLAANFHDGSVRADLEPVPACASLMYSALAVLAFFAKDGPYVSMKYGVDAHVCRGRRWTRCCAACRRLPHRRKIFKPGAPPLSKNAVCAMIKKSPRACATRAPGPYGKF